MYYCFVYPYINYAAEVWADTSAMYLSTVVKLQKKAIRIMNYSQRLEHTRPLFTKFNILRLEEIHIYKVALIMFKVYHKDTPMVFSSLFTKNCDIHNYETRQLNQFHVPFARTNYMLRSISFKGVRIPRFYKFACFVKSKLGSVVSQYCFVNRLQYPKLISQ